MSNLGGVCGRPLIDYGVLENVANLKQLESLQNL